MRAYQDTSLFQGIAQYEDDCGIEWRREHSQAAYTFFRKNGDSFICEGSMPKKCRRSSIKAIHDFFIALS
jgi:hypothetical protein